tara:strand:- start:676 stop:864 length:189 start_codon:yes stop_codon:yes gene_type:complete
MEKAKQLLIEYITYLDGQLREAEKTRDRLDTLNPHFAGASSLYTSLDQLRKRLEPIEKILLD